MPSLLTQLFVLTSGIALLTILLPLLPLKCLRILPLISSTINLMWAADEYMFLSSWLVPAYQPQADSLLPAWFSTWGPMGSRVLFSSFPFSISSGIANLLTAKWTLKASGALKWYRGGLLFTFVHFWYAPKALGLLGRIRRGEPEGRPTESMRAWIEMHLWRTLTADGPAFLCFAMGAVMAIQDVA
jgi:hypothetical protein